MDGSGAVLEEPDRKRKSEQDLTLPSMSSKRANLFQYPPLSVNPPPPSLPPPPLPLSLPSSSLAPLPLVHNNDSDASLHSTLNVNQAFLTPGSQALYAFRKKLTVASLTAAKSRLALERQAKDNLSIPALKSSRQSLYQQLRGFGHLATQIGGDRPLSYCAFHPHSKEQSPLLTGCWNGKIQAWLTPSLQPFRTWRGHEDRVTCVEYAPHHALGQSQNESSRSSVVALASSDAAGTISFWSDSIFDAPVLQLKGHHRASVARLAWHPHEPQVLASASYDTTFRLWDLASSASAEPCLLVQEGHSAGVHSLAWHPDGALLATGGLDSLILLWDLRAGRPLATLQGYHVDSVLSLDFSQSGTELVSGSADHTVRIWDLRKLRPLQTLYGHTNVVTTVKYATPTTMHGHGSSWLLSTSHDGSARIWGVYDWKCLSVLQTEGERKIMCGAISSSSSVPRDSSADSRPASGWSGIATVSYDKTIKLWGTTPVASPEKGLEQAQAQAQEQDLIK